VFVPISLLPDTCDEHFFPFKDSFFFTRFLYLALTSALWDNRATPLTALPFERTWREPPPPPQKLTFHSPPIRVFFNQGHLMYPFPPTDSRSNHFLRYPGPLNFFFGFARLLPAMSDSLPQLHPPFRPPFFFPILRSLGLSPLATQFRPQAADVQAAGFFQRFEQLWLTTGVFLFLLFFD